MKATTYTAVIQETSDQSARYVHSLHGDTLESIAQKALSYTQERGYGWNGTVRIYSGAVHTTLGEPCATYTITAGNIKEETR